MAFIFSPELYQKPEPVVIARQAFPDERGYFCEMYKYSEFKKNNIDTDFSQDNLSVSKKGVLRGMHYQKHYKAQAKLVSVIQGSIIDVIVDIRTNSDTFKRWSAYYLNDCNKTMLYVPEGFAHGFVALDDVTIVHYKCTNEYDPSFDAGIRYDDPDIGIEWPKTLDLIISEKDRNLPYLKDTFQ
jgi:dTDP-4-dehydrorhamnose 3,5-epimerase